MIKKIIYILVISLSFGNFLYGKNAQSSKSISQVKRMELIIEDNIKINKNFRKTSYNLKFIIPDIIKKEMLFPELNKGEIYIYNKGKKLTYLPMFNQKKIEDSSAGENTIIEVINYIFKAEKSDEDFKREYYARRVKGIKLGENTVIEFKKFNIYEGYLFPEVMSIKENNQYIGEIKITSLKINTMFDMNEFQIKE